jgi:hypothetical protein
MIIQRTVTGFQVWRNGLQPRRQIPYGMNKTAEFPTFVHALKDYWLTACVPTASPACTLLCFSKASSGSKTCQYHTNLEDSQLSLPHGSVL